MATYRPRCMTYREFVEANFDGIFNSESHAAYDKYMNARLVGIGAKLMETLHNTRGGKQLALSSAYLEFLAQRGLQDGNASRALFLIHLEESTPLPKREAAPRVICTSLDFEDLAHRTQRAQEQEWIKERPWMKSVLDAQRALQGPTPEMVMNCIDAMELRALGISGGD